MSRCQILFPAICSVALILWALVGFGGVASAWAYQSDSCMQVVAPHEGQSVPCSGPDGEPCVTIYADDVNCPGTITEVMFHWSPSGSDPWYIIDDVIYPFG
ncbi:MAG: hypothetical protein WBC77_12035, partial [Candidatus Zixiibacteriota bacterium]